MQRRGGSLPDGLCRPYRTGETAQFFTEEGGRGRLGAGSLGALPLRKEGRKRARYKPRAKQSKDIRKNNIYIYIRLVHSRTVYVPSAAVATVLFYVTARFSKMSPEGDIGRVSNGHIKSPAWSCDLCAGEVPFQQNPQFAAARL